MKVTVRLMIYNPGTGKRRQQFSITRIAPGGMTDVKAIYHLIETDPPVRSFAAQLEDGGFIILSSDRGRLTNKQVAKLKEFVLEMIQKQIPPKERRRR